MVKQALSRKRELSVNCVNSKMALLKFGNNQIEDSFYLAYKVDHEKYSEKARVSGNMVSCLIDDYLLFGTSRTLFPEVVWKTCVGC
jgi:hypothetical protein